VVNKTLGSRGISEDEGITLWPLFSKNNNVILIGRKLHVSTIKKIINQIEKFSPRKKSLADFIPLIELLISDLMRLLEAFKKVNKIPGKPGRSRTPKRLP
jgi:hypothetical protein